MLNRLPFLSALVLIIVAVMPASGLPPLRVALFGALSGPKAVYGLSHRDGARLAVESLRAASAPVAIELLEIDDSGEPGMVGPKAVDAVTTKQVHALLGSVDSGCTHVLAMVAVKTHTPHLTCVATDPSLTRAGTPWTFRTLADDQAQAGALVAWLKQRPLAGSVAIIAAESRYGRMGARTFARLARQAGLATLEPTVLTAGSVKEQIARVLQDRPSAVVVWTLAQDGRRVVSELRQLGYDGIIAGGDGLAVPAFFHESRNIAAEVVVTCPYDLSDAASENQEFVRAFRARYGRDPDSFAAHAYDTLRLLANAWRRGDGTREGLQKALSRIGSFPGATGTLGFDDTGNDTRPVRLAVCRDGRLVRLSE